MYYLVGLAVFLFTSKLALICLIHPVILCFIMRERERERDSERERERHTERER